MPRLSIDLNKISANTSALLKQAPGISIYGVTKSCLGSPEVARAMLAGGVDGLADSHVANLVCLRKNFPDASLLLLRQPMIAETETALDVADLIMITELEAARRLSRTALKKQLNARLILTLEMGDGREGITAEEFIPFLNELKRFKSIKVVGLAANVGCSFGITPTRDHLFFLVEMSSLAESILGEKVSILSGGNSGCLPLLFRGDLPPEINQLRIGEAILLGHETVSYLKIDGLSDEAFVLEAEIIEAKEKPIERGRQYRAIVALGQQDIATAHIRPRGEEILFSGRSSDQLVLTLQESSKVKTGDRLQFTPSYFALLAAMTSPYVEKVFVGL